ncbi:MAG: C-GCAxxG-C-C family protein [Bacillota bacterium]|nr:C-GCAxxG-C-C family protein [Bacillota bacterium]
MTEHELKEVLDLIEKKAVEAQLRDDACARSTMYGLGTYFPFISDEVVAATLSLIGGAGISSGSCGAYTSGLLAVGLKYNPLIEEEIAEEGLEKKDIAMGKIMTFRDAFIKEFGTTMCPEIHKIIFGRSFNLMDDQERDDFLSIPDHAEKCSAVVAKAARMAAEILLKDA